MTQVSRTTSSQETPLYEENHVLIQEYVVDDINGSILNSGLSNNENSNNISLANNTINLSSNINPNDSNSNDTNITKNRRNKRKWPHTSFVRDYFTEVDNSTKCKKKYLLYKLNSTFIKQFAAVLPQIFRRLVSSLQQSWKSHVEYYFLNKTIDM